MILSWGPRNEGDGLFVELCRIVKISAATAL